MRIVLTGASGFADAEHSLPNHIGDSLRAHALICIQPITQH
jgi:hypothetical protein